MITEEYLRLTVIELPGEPLERFDIGWVDESTRRYYLADRSNARVDVIDTTSDAYIGAIGEGHFTGAPLSNKLAGPNGVAVLPDLQQVWAGDGDSTVKVFDGVSGRRLASIATGGLRRVDELAYAPSLAAVLVANDAEDTPFVCLVSTSDFQIQGRVDFPQATNGLHQPVWDPQSNRFYVPVTEVDGDKARGEIAVIDPVTVRIVDSFAVSECQPAGLAVGPDRQLCVGCSKNAIAAGFAPRTLIIDLATGKVSATITEVGGSDEVWYDHGAGRYYLAASGMVGGPVLGIVDTATRRWIASVPTSPDAHSVAADPASGHVYVPLTPSEGAPKGGIGVYTRRVQ